MRVSKIDQLVLTLIHNINRKNVTIFVNCLLAFYIHDGIL